jgi:hypothetical protein
MVFFGWLYYYVGNIAFSAYIFFLSFGILRSIKRKNIPRNRIYQFSLISLLVTLLIIKAVMYSGELTSLLFKYRFWFGFIVFYIGFLAGIKFNLVFILKISVSMIIVEAILINTFIDQSMMPNFFSDDARVSRYFGFYLRPNGIAGNSTASSIIVLSMLTYCYHSLSKKWRVLATTAIICSYSVTGLLLLIFISLIKVRGLKSFMGFMIGILVLISIVILSNDWRISHDYINTVFILKINQIIGLADYISFMGVHDFEKIKFYGDFALYDMILGVGIIIFSLYLLLVATVTNKSHWPVFILIIGSLHYQVVFSMPGQILFAYYLATIGDDI